MPALPRISWCADKGFLYFDIERKKYTIPVLHCYREFTQNLGQPHRLDLKGICISTGSACDSVDAAISHVIQATKVPVEYAEGTIRVTFGEDNTVDDAITVSKELSHILCSGAESKLFSIAHKHTS